MQKSGCDENKDFDSVQSEEDEDSRSEKSKESHEQNGDDDDQLVVKNDDDDDDEFKLTKQTTLGVGLRADIFSLGVLAQVMFTGQSPFALPVIVSL